LAPLKHSNGTILGSLTEISNGVDYPQEAVSFDYSLWTSVNGVEYDHPFYSTGFSGSGAMLNGPKGNAIFHECPSALYSQCQSFMPVDPTSDYDSNYMTRLLAASNPATPTVLVPALIYETLHDAPELIHLGGELAFYIRDNYQNGIRIITDTLRALPNGVHAINLAYQFGIRPFVQDASSLIGIMNAIEKRRKQLKQLQSGKGERRRISLGQDTWVLNGSLYAWSTYGAGVITKFTSRSVATHWGVAKWKPTQGQPLPSSDSGIAAQLAGLTPDSIALNVWEALPWSWFADYFFKIQLSLQASNRTIATPVSAVVMTSVEHTTDTDPVVDGPFSLSAGKFKAYSHRRSTGSILPEVAAVIPNLGWQQLSVLGSLAVLRAH